MSWLLLTAISVLCRAFMGVVHKASTNTIQVSAATQAVLFTVFAALFSLLASPFLGGIDLALSTEVLPATLLVIVGQGFGNITYFAAMNRLTSGTAQIAFSSILLFNTALAVLFFGLSLSHLNIVGILLLLGAIGLVITGRLEMDPTGVLLMTLAAFLYAIFQLASVEMAQSVSAATYMFIAYSGPALLVFLLRARVVCRDLKVLKNWSTTLLLVSVSGTLSLGNFLFAYLAYRAAPEPTKVAILLTSQVVIAVVVSYFALNERSHLGRKIAAALLVIASAFLIKD